MTNNRFKMTDEIESTAEKTMANLVDKNIKLNFDEISSFKFPLDEPFGLQIIYDNTLYCFITRFSSKNKNLICCGPGAHERNVVKNGEVIKPPFFARWSWEKYYSESYIAYADPMYFYDDKIKIGWFVGNKKQWYLKDLSIIIQELCKNQKIQNNNILFFGSSLGGFTSVVLGTLIRNSKVLINNSQLFILNYKKPFPEQVLDIVHESFDGTEKNEMINEIKYRLDVVELFKKENYAPFITYYVNTESENDIFKHEIPFLEKVYKLEQFNGLDIINYREVKEFPHQPLPPEKTIELIKEYCKNYLYNNSPTKTDENKDNHIGENHTDSLKKEIKRLNEENNELKKEKDSLINSNSWKLTSPLRKVKKIFK